MCQCAEDCINHIHGACETDIINMTSDGGWKKLLRLIEKDKEIFIQKLIVPISPSGPFLQRISTLFDIVMYVGYREPTFQIPDGNTIREVVIMRAVGLKAFIAGTNTQLETLNIQQCTLDRLPPTLPKMIRLKDLSITICMLSGLRLDMLVENQYLTSVDLSYNRIRQIFPLTARTGKTINIERLDLTGNQLEHLDMSVFASMSKLGALFILENPLTHIGVTEPIILPQLGTILLYDNQLVSIDLRNVTMPQLTMFAISSNAMSQMPLLPKTLPKLDYLSFDQNQLTRVDLSYFRTYRQLKNIYITNNQISTVYTSSPIKLPVTLLRFDGNTITSLNLTGCDMPNITTLNLANNRLTVVPPVFESFPKVRLTMNANPLTCNTLLPYKDKFEGGRFQKDIKPISWVCDTTSSFLIAGDDKVCCDS
ncbi:leucine-rich repeat-containing protein 15-like [Anopheles maculipalpis]|uniref:leucine-rich repeat-containing protein 15-like n=1 Tax=Anopheles maculipalpis TaxID=1496333 RepID=UPI002158B731|nr:leucine-rich repeat-containing protein 15-like [Anopheles maculipalpis]